jgi:hypothetical protein
MSCSQQYVEKNTILRKDWEISCIRKNNIPELLEILDANFSWLDDEEKELLKKYRPPLN